MTTPSIEELFAKMIADKEYLKIIMTYLPHSKMPEDEKVMWAKMIKVMEQDQIQQLATILYEEFRDRMDLYMQYYEKSANNAI